jgi:hypothetical protein
MSVVQENAYLNKARILYHVIFYSFIFSSIGHALARASILTGNLASVFPFFPAVIGFVISPIGLYFIINSYLKKEANTKDKKVYLIGIVLANIITLTVLLFVLFYGSDILKM